MIDEKIARKLVSELSENESPFIASILRTLDTEDNKKQFFSNISKYTSIKKSDVIYEALKITGDIT